MSGRKSLAELAAELEDPTPQDVDPEEFGHRKGGSDDEDSADEDTGREHYEDVGTSKLRRRERPSLGAQYSGSKVSRKELELVKDQEDDPFARKANPSFNGQSGSDDDEYDDPDAVDFNARDDEDEEIDSDEAFEDGEEEIFRRKGFTFKDSADSKATGPTTKSNTKQFKAVKGDQQGDLQGDSDQLSVDAEFDHAQMNGTDTPDSVSEDEANKEHSSNQWTDDGEQSDDQSSGTGDESERQANADVLRAMLSTEQKQVVSSLSEAMENEVAKGATIKNQYSTFDSFVGSRIHLQKSLIAANSLPLAARSVNDHKALSQAAEAAESASIEVLNSLTSLLHDLRRASLAQDSTKPLLGKRSFSATISTSSQDINRALSASQQASKSQRRTILKRWANKTQVATISPRNRLVQKSEEDGLLTALDGQLLGTNRDHHVRKAQIAKSCAPLQQAAASGSQNRLPRDDADHDAVSEDQENHQRSLPVYDDADFYALLLRELIEHKKAYSDSTPGWVSSPAIAEATTPSNLLRANRTKRANLDTKASKGRKVKYTVHEKLQNFLAPMNLGTWEIRQAEELFAGLLGRKVPRLDEADDVEILSDAGEDSEMQGLKLFGGV